MKSSPPQITRGYVLLLALVVASIISTVTIGFLNYFSTALHSERFALASAQAQALAEAGIDKAVYELNQNAGYSGESDVLLGAGTFTTSVSSIDNNTKRITATSHVPNSTNPTATKIIKVTATIDTSIVAFRYGVQIGQGGAILNNGSRIEGNLFSNGDVSGSGTITGDATVAVGTDLVANQEWTTQNSGFNVGNEIAHAAVAQSFKPSENARLARLSLYLKKIGNPGDLIIKIVADDSGSPSTTVLAGGTLPASQVTSTYGFAEITLASTPPVVDNQTYWIIAVAPVSDTDYFIWGLDANSGYSRGVAKYSSNWSIPSPAWASIAGDLDFKMYVNGIATTLSGVTVQGNAWAHTLSNCSIGGNASSQVISNCNITGTKSAGVTPSAPVPLSISDAQIAEWEAIAEAGGTLAGPVLIENLRTYGPKKIDGDLTVGNGGTLVLSGPVWVNGNVTFSNNATLLVSPSTGNSGAIIIADATGNTAAKGVVELSNNVEIHGNGTANSFPMIISTNTSSNAMLLENNADSIILYAPYGTVTVSNNAGANQITAKLLHLLNNATISYVSGLQSTSFSNGPGGSWTVVPGSYVIVK